MICLHPIKNTISPVSPKHTHNIHRETPPDAHLDSFLHTFSLPHHYSKIPYVLGECSLMGPIFVNSFRIFMHMCPISLLNYASMENVHILPSQLLAVYSSPYHAEWLDYGWVQILGPVCNEHYNSWMLWQTGFQWYFLYWKWLNQWSTMHWGIINISKTRT